MSEKEIYAVGYHDSALDRFESRTVNEYAGFLLPHLKPDMKLLDCGCGPGSITVGFAQMLPQGQAIGIDVEDSQFERGKKSAQKTNANNVTFQKANIYELPFADETFDVVFTNAMLWVLSDAKAAMREMKRVLKKGGLFAAREPVDGGVFYYPDTPDIKWAFDLHARGMRLGGGDIDIGKKLRAYAHEIGFKDAQASVTSEYWGNEERIKDLFTLLTNYWDNSPLRQKFIENIGEENLKKLQQTLLSFKDHHKALFCMPWGEVLARK